MSSKNAQKIFIGFLFIVLLHNASAQLVPENETTYLTFSPHDLSFELTGSAHLNVCISKPLNDTFQIALSCHCDLVNVSQWNLTIEPQTIRQEVVVYGIKPGQAVLNVVNISDGFDIDIKNAYVRVAISRHQYLDLVSDVVGWIYFFAWTVYFFPQMWTNYQRKSVEGLNFDFLSLNVLGFFSYSLFNCGLYYLPLVRSEYFALHPYGVMPVQIQDIAFALLAFLCSALTGVQALIYDRGSQTISKVCIGLLSASFIFLLISLVLSCTNIISWLSYLYYFSYIKLGVTTVKYIPQAYFNYRRQSTKGWNIGTVMLDVIGGAFSLLQMFIIAYNYADWSSISGDPTKLFLSVVSLFFDFIFIVQHYALYKEKIVSYAVLSTEFEQGHEVAIN